LDGQGKVVRIHGGAVLAPDDRQDLPFEVRATTMLEEKKAIAARAVQHIAEGDVIGLDASSTAYELARIIPDVLLTVVTSSLPVTALLMPRTRIRVVSSGGILDRPSRSWTGWAAERTLERFNIKKLFLSAKGVDLVRGLSEVTDDQARLKRRMIDMADRTFLLADHSKFGVKSVVFYANLADADVFITDARIDSDVITAMAEIGVEVETVG
jgi:DeoR/GlpR family transcriptional regulator of sugar metabolism